MEGDTAHFLMVTFWESEEAIRAFAGDDISVAKYYDFDKNFLLELEPCAAPHLVESALRTGRAASVHVVRCGVRERTLRVDYE